MAEKKQEAIVELKPEERNQLMENLMKLPKEQMLAVAETISMLVRAWEGRQVETGDVISRLINLKNEMERSRFPTYPLLAKQVYLRLVAHYNPSAKACKVWADLEAEALIAYRGQNRDEYVKMAVGVRENPQGQQFYFGQPQPQQPQQEQGKKHFWSRGKKEEPSEFVNQ